ncbi:MAG: hypothetical protein HZB16_06010 [Armatimonadetes bacterium]|nr:hypothetical protein [Armatimonadota bacterium]
MAEQIREDVHAGGLVELGTDAQDPASLAMGFDGTVLRRVWTEAQGHRELTGYELAFENEDEEPLGQELYAIYRINDPLLKARGEILFAGMVRVTEAADVVTLRSVGEPDIATMF